MSIPDSVQQIIAGQLRPHLASVLPQVVTAQETYMQEHGRYWQGLEKTVGQPDPPSVGTHPPWSTTFAAFFPDQAGLSVQIHEYTGPQGTGWLLTARLASGSATYSRVINYGPCEWMSHDWQQEGGIDESL